MLNDLKLVQGAVARKDYVPELTHFHIEEGRIYGFNGTLAISTPTDLAVTATPKASSFIKAIEAIPEKAQVVMNFTAAGRLSIRAGNFRAYVECHDESKGMVKVAPEGDVIELPDMKILATLKTMSPFMGVDASRPWAMGVYFSGQSAYATNNILLLEHWLPIAFPHPFVLPAAAVREMLRIGLEPKAIQTSDSAVTFHFANGAWMRTQLISGEWPDLTRILERPCDAKALPPGFFDGLQRLADFVDESDRVLLRKDCLRTHETEDTGAVIDLPGFEGVGCHQLHQMLKLDGLAKTIDLTLHPAPCLFFGDALRGAIVGMAV